MARIARRGLRLQGIPLFSLRQSFQQCSQDGGDLPLTLFEPRYVDLARRIEPPKGSSQFGYIDVLQRHPGGGGVLVEAKNLQWLSQEGPCELVAHGLRRFRVLSLRTVEASEGAPLYLAHVQLLADRDLSRSPSAAEGEQGADAGTLPMTIFGQVYVQSGGWGFASYHFEDGGPYISYESGLSKDFPTLDDGSQPPPRKPFEDVSFDPATRTFRGTVSWAPATWQGSDRWDYEMVFSSDFGEIVGGGVRWHFQDRQKEKFARYGVNLHYKRLRMGVDSTGTAVKDVLLRSGIAPSAVEASLQVDSGNAEGSQDRSSKVVIQLACPRRALRSERRRVRRASKLALAESASEGARLGAVGVLASLALPPLPVQDAEDALFRVLREASNSGDLGPRVEAITEEALWNCWRESGDAEVNAELRRGMALMEDQRLQDAAEAFTRVVEMAPAFAEGWNKRATALCAMGEFTRSIEDCEKVLELKPRHFGCLTGMGVCQYLGQGNKDEALRWLRAALEVHPGMRGASDMIEQIEIQDIMTTHLKPRIDRIVAGFEKGAQVPTEFSEVCSWDVHRIKQSNTEASSADWAYFFRIRIRSPNDCRSPVVQSRARFYVFHAVDGKVFPFARPTQGNASFKLEPGAEFKFCWTLVAGRELKGAAAGALLEHLAPEGGGGESRFAAEDLPPLMPLEAPEISPGELMKLGEGYLYTGQLDLGQVGF